MFIEVSTIFSLAAAALAGMMNFRIVLMLCRDHGIDRRCGEWLALVMVLAVAIPGGFAMVAVSLAMSYFGTVAGVITVFASMFAVGFFWVVALSAIWFTRVGLLRALDQTLVGLHRKLDSIG